MEDKIFVCGNCHKFLGADKYCKYCGTERKKGKFLPQNNEVYMVYGPQVNQKFKCSSCGYNWLSIALGGENCEYCPECGEKTFREIRREMPDDCITYATIKDCFDDESRPILLSKEQVEHILKQRRSCADISEKNIRKLMEQMDIPIPTVMESGYFMGTEEEYERKTLIGRILTMDGDDPTFNRHEKCPNCASAYHAALGYALTDSEHNILKKNVHINADSENPVVYNRNYRFDVGDDNSAYYCLQCGTEYGQLDVN